MELARGNGMPPIIGIVSRQDQSGMWPGYALYGQGLTYARAVALAGGAPVLIPLGLQESAWRSIYDRLDGLLFPGGVDVNPARYGQEPIPQLGKVDEALDEAEWVLAGWALSEQIPVLGICRGIQLINVAAGGTLYQDLAAQVPGVMQHACSAPEYPREHRAHAVHLAAQSRTAAAMQAVDVMVNSRHHQAVRDVAPGFAATAWADDGVIEGIEHQQSPFIVGVQWHPESMAESDPQMLSLFRALVVASDKRA